MIGGAFLWILSNFMTDISRDLDMIGFWSKITIVGPIFIGYFFYRLSIFFPRFSGEQRSTQRLITIAACALLALVPTPINISSVYLLSDNIPAIRPGLLYVAFLIYFIILLVLAFRNLFHGYSFFSKLEKLQVQYISLGMGISIIFGTLANLILPLIGHSEFVNYGPYFILFFVVFTSYSIIKFKMFDIKIIATELLVFSLWVIIFIRVIISEDITQMVTNSILLILTIIIGIFLIRSILKEVSQREKIQLLATDLQKANDRLTDLDRQKSEFVSFATHQLRAPLTAMKGYASLVLEGDMGAITDQTKEAVNRIFESANTLTSIVDDYLNVTRIELGTMKYAFETIDLKTLIEDVIAELKPNIDKATKVKFIFGAENMGSDYRITADRDKLKQVIANLIDNSLKYTPQGSVGVSLSYNRSKHKFVFMLKDTGIGIAPETLPHLFNKFSRAGNANKTNIKGTGLGLFVAKEIVAAHHGMIRAESMGEGKGSTFIVELEPFAKV